MKNLPPIEDLCKPIPPSSTIKVHSLEYFDDGDIPYFKPPDQCLDEFDNFIVKQDHSNERIQGQLLENSRIISNLHGVLERTANDVKGLVKHFHMVQTQIEQITKVQKDLLVNASKNNDKHACGVDTRGGASTQDPLYPEVYGYAKYKISDPSRKRKGTDTPEGRLDRLHLLERELAEHPAAVRGKGRRR